MAPDDEDALSRAIRAQHISYGSVRNEERQLNERVRKLFYNELMMFQFSYCPEWGYFDSRKYCLLEYWSTKPDLDEMVIFRAR